MAFGTRALYWTNWPFLLLMVPNELFPAGIPVLKPTADAFPVWSVSYYYSWKKKGERLVISYSQAFLKAYRISVRSSKLIFKKWSYPVFGSTRLMPGAFPITMQQVRRTSFEIFSNASSFGVDLHPFLVSSSSVSISLKMPWICWCTMLSSLKMARITSSWRWGEENILPFSLMNRLTIFFLRWGIEKS